MTDSVANLEEGEKHDLTLQMVEQQNRKHPGQATRIVFRDVNDHQVKLSVFRNSPLTELEWCPDFWYRLENITIHNIKENTIVARGVGKSGLLWIGNF